MKIYTGTGDEGETGLFGGPRVRKDDVRVRAYGEVDELCAWLGYAASLAADVLETDLFREVQGDLFTLGAELATPPEASPGAAGRIAPLSPERARRLEGLIDAHEAGTEPLRSFILPGGDGAAAALQVARAVCRRAERAVVALARDASVNPAILVYLNRLSDLLFVLARVVNARRQVEEPRWPGQMA